MFTAIDFFRNRFFKLDWVLLGCVIVLASIGLVTLYSLKVQMFYKQFIWYLFFFLIFLVSSNVNWRWILVHNWFRLVFYWLSVGLIIFSGFQSVTVRGTKSWIIIGNFQFEPAELVKIALILILASFFSKRHAEAWFGKNIIISLFYAALPAAIVITHPDMGAALVFMSVWFGFLVLNGIRLKRVLIIFSGFLILVAVGWMFVLRPYQKQRITAFLNPESDPLGASYNVNQAKIAIGSAGFWGKGFGEGTQTHLKFLPEAETDFIFAAFVEEWGLVGGVVLVLTFMALVSRILRIGLVARNNDFKFISLGVALVLVVHFFVNVGSNLGLTPVTGITLPFVSYGGSNLLTTAVMVSIIQRIKFES